MNKQTKFTARGLSVLLGLLLVVGMFSGCSDGGGSSSQASSQASSQSSSAVSSTPQSSEAGGASSETAGASVKNITLQVVHQDGTKKDFDISTEAKILREALEQEKLVEGEESEFGLFVKTVDGETVDDANQEWWCLTKGGEMWNNGVDTTELSDGDAYEFTFTVGY